MDRVSDKAAGWYPDPDGENRQRYWDGDSWTEYYTPLAAPLPEAHGSTSAVEDYPYLVASKTGPHQNLMAQPVPVGSKGGWPTTAVPGGDGQTQEFSGGGRRSRAHVWALVAASLLVVMLVAGIGWWALGGSPADDPTSADPTNPTDGETVVSGMALDSPASATVPIGGLWVGTLTLDAETTILVDARADSSDGDLRIAIVPEGDSDPVAENDDRGTNLEALTGNSLDPLAVATLPAGNYEVRVDERERDETDFTVVAYEVSTALEDGTTAEMVLQEGGYWFGALASTGGSYAIDVRSEQTSGNNNPDPVLVIVGETERQYINDDRDGDSRDPYLEQELPEGTWVVLVFEYRGRALNASLAVTEVS